MAADKGGDAGAQSVGPDEETKRKFREALDRKTSHGGRDVSDTSEHAKLHGTHGPEATGAQQMFRRKSG